MGCGSAADAIEDVAEEGRLRNAGLGTCGGNGPWADDSKDDIDGRWLDDAKLDIVGGGGAVWCLVAVFMHK